MKLIKYEKNGYFKHKFKDGSIVVAKIIKEYTDDEQANDDLISLAVGKLKEDEIKK